MERKATLTFRNLSFLLATVVLGALFSGCMLLGLGAAAGAVVGGCSVLDENEDDMVTEAEFTSGLFASWDTDDDGELTESEFEAGTDRGEAFDEISNDFESWDTNNDDALTEAEFRAGVSEDGDTSRWMDRRCDDLGL